MACKSSCRRQGQLAASTGNRFAALSGKIDLTNIDQVNERIEYLQKKSLKGKKVSTLKVSQCLVGLQGR